jgi:hypothetical protein
MSRVSSLVLGTVVAGIVATALGCRVEVSTKTRYKMEDVPRTDTVDWDGTKPIEIEIKGVGVSVNGGVTVTSDPAAKRVTANARVIAMTFPEEKADADLSISEALDTFKIDSSGSVIRVECGHGTTHRNSNGGESGCELVNITVPAGDAQKPLAIKVLSGSGTQTLQLSNATISKVETNSNGADINADLPATKGGIISLVAESDDIAVKLPSSFAADEVILQADKIELAKGFEDIKSGAGRGTPGTGLASLKLTAKEFGKITLQ